MGNLDEDERYWISEDEEDAEGAASTHAEEGNEAPGGGSHTHGIYHTKYGSKQLVPMDTILERTLCPCQEERA